MDEKELEELRASVRRIDHELAALLRSGWSCREALPCIS